VQIGEELGTDVLVRCLACHRLYTPIGDPGRDQPQGCPDCGSAEWLAATIPIDDSIGGE
jgi:hypothetical protein